MMSQPTCAGSIHRPQAPPVLPPLVRLVAARAAHGAEHARTSTSTVMSPQTCHMRRHSAFLPLLHRPAAWMTKRCLMVKTISQYLWPLVGREHVLVIEVAARLPFSCCPSHASPPCRPFSFPPQSPSMQERACTGRYPAVPVLREHGLPSAG